MTVAPTTDDAVGPTRPPAGPPGRPGRPGRSRRRLIWPLLVLLVAVLIALVVGSFRHAISVQRSDDPRSTTAQGDRALAQLLTDQGVRIHTTESVDDAVARSDAGTLLVVASPDRLNAEQAGRIGRATYGRLLLLRPGTIGLRAFGVPADVVAQPAGPVQPGCREPAATDAGAIVTDDFRSGYRGAGGAVTVSCYADEDSGAGWLRVGGPFGPVDLVAGGVSNAVLAQQGNAAFGMNVFGAQPRIVWLMGQRAAAPPGARGPQVLPSWWVPALAQAFLALVVVAVWRGRRLGPILSEPLPVTVRAAETVEGHGRLYARIGARDRAAEALRGGVRNRLARAYGQRLSVPATEGELMALSSAVAARTGRPTAEVGALLAGPPPAGDDDLLTLAHHLDRLEQEARRL